MKRVLVAGITLLAMLGSASAADMARRAMPTKAPIYAPVYNWSGFYVGINAGGGWGRSNFTGIPTTGSFNVDGGMIGGTIGYNWQFPSNLVVGLEGDLDWTNIRGSAACGAVVCNTRNEWLGTARARVGYAFDRFLPYVTGGLAVGDVQATTTTFPAGDRDTRAGWTIGAGLEAAIAGPVTAKVEYLYADLGKFDCGALCTATPPQNVKFTTNIVRGGINVRF